MSKYKHIFFDLDHTLWDFHTNSVEALEELFVSFDLSNVTKVSSSKYFIDRYIFHNDRMWDMYRKNRMSKSRLRKARFEAALKDVGLDDKKLAKQIGMAYLDVCPRKTKLNEGAMEVVLELKKNHVLHILSNGFHETQLVKLECSGLAPHFENVITSEKAGAKKPSPRIFQFAERVTGALKTESLMVGDNLEIDVKGAHAFGWDAIHYNEMEVTHIFPAVKRLPDIMGMLGS
ncbi:MAG: YjjG family noncanonical pyrimidine nucleotidase [Cryomorphaceae bacterium]